MQHEHKQHSETLAQKRREVEVLCDCEAVVIDHVSHLSFLLNLSSSLNPSLLSSQQDLNIKLKSAEDMCENLREELSKHQQLCNIL